MVPTLATSRPMRTSVSSRSSRMSGSSSTTRTWAAVLFIRLVSCGARLQAADAEVGARRVIHVLERGAVGGAQLACEIKAEPGALRFGREEGLEQLPLPRARHARAVVDDGKLDTPAVAAQRDAHRAVLRPGIAHGIAQQVPHHLPQVLAIELDPGVGARLHGEALGARRFVGHELGQEFMQPRMHAYRAGRDAVAAIELQDIRDEPLEPSSVVLED